MIRNPISINLPAWLSEQMDAHRGGKQTDADKMRFALELARRNVELKGGGPFGAAIYEVGSGKLVSAGVNLVESGACSLLHAEVVAIMLAQKHFNTFDLAAENVPALELYSLGMPCVQCFGAIWWSGLARLVMAARADDVSSITGFNEGPITPDWKSQLESRPGRLAVAVVTDFLRDEAIIILKQYVESGGLVYNPGST